MIEKLLTQSVSWQAVTPRDLYALPGMTHDANTIEELLIRYRERDENTREPIWDLGFRVSVLHRIGARETIEVSMVCGSHSHQGGLIPNNLIVRLPEGGPTLDELLNVDTLCRILALSLNIMDARWGVVAHPSQLSADHPFLGWLTLLDSDIGGLPELPLMARAIPIESRGTILAAFQTPHDPTELDSKRYYYDLERRLREASLMEPIDYRS